MSSVEMSVALLHEYAFLLNHTYENIWNDITSYVDIVTS
jgi:hypothetical protein